MIYEFYTWMDIGGSNLYFVPLLITILVTALIAFGTFTVFARFTSHPLGAGLGLVIGLFLGIFLMFPPLFKHAFDYVECSIETLNVSYQETGETIPVSIKMCAVRDSINDPFPEKKAFGVLKRDYRESHQ